VQEILFKTLQLITEMNLQLKNYSAAKISIKDLESLQRNDANTYILKIRVLLASIHESGETSKVL
jgi:hypothetical protein